MTTSAGRAHVCVKEMSSSASCPSEAVSTSAAPHLVSIVSNRAEAEQTLQLHLLVERARGRDSALPIRVLRRGG
eukprot:1817922-Pleurochrysis_carterae.AAC.1